MSEHFIKKCSCGAVISQCRCADPSKKVNIIQDGCPACISKLTACEFDLEKVTAIQCHESGVVLAVGDKWELDKPITFQWMPGGIHTINAHYGKKGIELTVEVDANAAKLVQASLNRWHEVRAKQTPFGCVEHREEEAAIRLPKDVAAFEWKTEPEPGIYCTATPTELGAKNVNGRIHSSWSPSFATDADYDAAKDIGGRLVFPKGVRGSRENPAKVIGCAFSVGSLTNKPAFREIAPVRAKEDEGEEGEVKASGTSEGVKKSWEHRREGAMEATRRANWSGSEAHNATETALSTDKEMHHENAERLHIAAAHAHEKAATLHKDVVESKGIPKRHKEHHESMARMHTYAAKLHREEAHSHSKNWMLPMKASEKETEDTTKTVDAKYAADETKLKDIYAKYGEPEDPLQAIYDRVQVEAAENSQPAGCS